MTTPNELSEAVALVVARAQARVGANSIGAQQYYVEGEPQRFEVLNWHDWFEYMREEALDIVTYGVMLNLRIDRLESEVYKRLGAQ
jgi:hypothetical protein